MEVIPLTQVGSAGLGKTSRRDAWWVAPLGVFVGLSAFVVYATWAAFQNAHYTFGPYLSPFYSPEIFGDSPACLVRPQAGLVARPAAVLAGAADPAVPRPLPLHLLLLPRRLLQGVLGRSAGVRGRRAAQELLRRELVPADPAERPPLLPLRGPRLHRRCWPTTSGWRCGSRIRPPGRTSSASASAPWSWSLNVVLLAGYTFGCHVLRHLVGGFKDEVSKSPVCD